jgi:ATP-dependent DNA helicase HFM1/MER3
MIITKLKIIAQNIHYFGEEFRPVPLRVHAVSYAGPSNNIYLFEKSLDEKVPEVIRKFSDGLQSIIFCSSKKNCEQLAAFLTSRLSRSGSHKTFGAPPARAALLSDSVLKNLVLKGTGYHHAGLPPNDRAIMEQLFLEGFLQVLCATSTLAHGVNLPAHLVIIKGTNCWRGSSQGYAKLPVSDIIQMTGRCVVPLQLLISQ